MSYGDEIAPDVVSPHDDKHQLTQPLRHLDTVIALYDFPGTQPSNLPLTIGDTVYVLSKNETGWWDGVVLTNNELQRGWFPSNYVRSVHYVQPVLNKLKSNKELDSITAANTAANVLIPSFTALLQKNLNDSEKNAPSNSTRKNSMVSFASSESQDSNSNATPEKPAGTEHNSAISTIKDNSVYEPLLAQENQPIDPLDHIEHDQSHQSKVVDVHLAEHLVHQYRESTHKVPTWINKTTIDGNMVFYCPQIDVYCESVPMTTFSLTFDFPPLIDIPDHTILNNNFVMSDNAGLNDNKILNDSLNGSNKSLNTLLKRDSDVSVGSNTSSQYHHFNQPLFAMDGLFYDHPMDIKKWSQLSSEFSYLLNLSFKAIKDNNKHLFNKNFSKINLLIANIASSIKLSALDYTNTKYERSIKRKFKRICRSQTQIYVNSILQLNVLHYSNQSSSSHLFNFDISQLNKSTSVSTASVSSSVSTIRQLPILSVKGGGESPSQGPEEMTPLQQIEAEIENIKLNLDLLIKVFQKLTKDKKFRRADYDGSDNSEEEKEKHDDEEAVARYDVLPQIYTRFISDEFNGGNWCNPFFNTDNPILNASGNDLKNKNHQKVLIDKSSYHTVKNLIDEMEEISKETLAFLSPESQHLYYNQELRDERNSLILRLIYKFLYYASSMIDTLESFDFTVFCLIKKFNSQEDDSKAVMNNLKKWSRSEEGDSSGKPSTTNVSLPSFHVEGEKNEAESDKDSPRSETKFAAKESLSSSFSSLDVDPKTEGFNSNLTFDYPVVLEFFHYKQNFHHLISRIIMATQSLTVEDPEVFKGMKEEDPLYYSKDLMKSPSQKAAMLLTNLLTQQIITPDGPSISSNTDSLMSSYLEEGLKFFEEILGVIKNLIDERETILNYSTRVLHDDFNVQLLIMERNNTVASEKSEDMNNNFFTGKKSSQAKDIPWYLEGDEEFDLLLDIKGNIKGGTKEALVCHLTHHDLFDSNFNTAFLLTFPTMMSLNELINMLIQRFDIEAPEGLSYEEYNTWISKKQNPIRLRVLNIMKLSLEKYWSNSYYNERIIKLWIEFLETPQASGFSIAKTILSHLNKLLQGETVMVEREPSVSSGRAPAPLTRMSIVKKLKLLDIDYIELARQLTIREFKLYSKITKFQCLAKVWGKKSGLNENIDSITNFIKSSNQLTNFVAFMILRKDDTKKRVQIIRYFVQVAEKCRQYNNFSAMTAIISALYSSPIHRLKKTWKYVSNDTLTHLQNMNKLMNSSRNFNEYRDVLKFIGSEPCVPFFGVYLSDLTFVYHGNPDTLLNRKRMINFSKRAKTSDIVLGLDRFKNTGYNLLLVPEIQKYIDNWFEKCPTIEEQYQLSLNLEPRENVSGPRTNRPFTFSKN